MWNWAFPLLSLGLAAYGASRPYKLRVTSTPPQIIPSRPNPPPAGWGPITIREPVSVPPITVPGRWWNPETGQWLPLEPGQTAESILAEWESRQRLTPSPGPPPPLEVPRARWEGPPLSSMIDPMRSAWLDAQSRFGWGSGGAFSPTSIAAWLGLWPELYPAEAWADFLRQALT